jgi:hypothetical protein
VPPPSLPFTAPEFEDLSESDVHYRYHVDPVSIGFTTMIPIIRSKSHLGQWGLGIFELKFEECGEWRWIARGKGFVCYFCFALVLVLFVLIRSLLWVRFASRLISGSNSCPPLREHLLKCSIKKKSSHLLHSKIVFLEALASL